MFKKFASVVLLLVGLSFANPQDLIGKKFVDFYGKDESGKVVKASEYIGKGKPAVIVYWAIGDVDTYKVLPKINQLYKKYKDKVIFIAPLLSVSNPKEVQEAKKFIPIDMPVWLAGSDSIKGYSIEKVDVPYLVFIDKNGNIVDIMTTARDIKKIEENIKKLL
ncbi:putative cytochrome c assembly protein [Sulfurihydrogenibium azorense Az-Fu1]|jgi:thiol-disulfide isomerase/thioredoxin|uniref:Putative cytochrome c assembly protein n=1 Tax=Sulfurihydrogenibium azorense (strain DSM 15241 / OCM 825 / Az-Fu1) TaxID=204536 RepID=C1DXJ3_SULAA|nr:TlpA disulfide reductase family protein [Sulfurihydrogenibium azorense]ACN98390.1 putative cytochrome c assembly protein [Sulfurihydrogenibium azorense Az-Fu1]